MTAPSSPAAASFAGLDGAQVFAHGVASGDPYANSVILWTRVSPPPTFSGAVDVQWQISTSADFSPASIVDSGVFSTTADRDWTVKVEAKGLNPDSPYHYRFKVGDVVSMAGDTKTLPVGSDPVRLAVFSCANFPAAEQFDAYGRAVAINADHPYDAWVHLGDYIYEYGPGGYGEAEGAADSRGFLPNREIVSLADYRQRYAQYHTDANLRALRAAAPLIAIWDDHETANDSWRGGAQNHQPATEGDWIARRDAAIKAYYEWMPIREPGLRQASDGATAASPLTQGYRSFNFGDVLALHVLETRLTARDQQLSYPDAAAVQARIGAILADPAQTLTYATRLGLTPPSSAAAVPAFAQALAPAVTQELVIATVQKAWGDPSRHLVGATEMAWLQQQMASSPAAWQVLGQQVLMESMAIPAELLINAGNPSLLDKYAAPLQKLATGTPFASLSPAEQALFAEAGKIPYNLDAWDGYGVDRETILQTATALGKQLISLAGDTHNAWAGLLDTMSAGSKPAGTVAGVEFATPGVTSPGFEKYLPGADAYIKARYPAVDGLAGLFTGYINGLKYSDVNRRGFLDFTVTPDQAIGNFQLLNGFDPFTGAPIWNSETVVANRSLNLSVGAEASPLINWQPGWRQLDLVFGLAVDAAGNPQLLDPASFAAVPRDGLQLPDVTVMGSAGSERIFVGAGSRVEAGDGGDELFNTDSLGGNLLVGGAGVDQFFLRAAGDRVVGGNLLANALSLGLPAVMASVDQDADIFLLDSSSANGGPLQILDFNPAVDQILLDGRAPQGTWSQIRQKLQALGVAINATPSFAPAPITLNLFPGQEVRLDLAASLSDPDADPLTLVVLEGPAWIRASGTQLIATPPAGTSQAQLAGTRVVVGVSDGQAVTAQSVQLNVLPPSLSIAPLAADQAEGDQGVTHFTFLVSRSGDVSGTSSVSWDVVGISPNAVASSDFQPASLPNGSLLFAPGQTSATITLDLRADLIYEADESFSLNLSNPSGATLSGASASALGVVRNDDPPYIFGPATIGGVNLGTTLQGDYALRNGSAAPIRITFFGQDSSPSNPGAGWSAIGAVASGSGYHVYWRNSLSNQYCRWLINGSGALVHGALITAQEFFGIEASLNYDLNVDGKVGLPYVPGAATIGSVNLGTVNLGGAIPNYALKDGNAAPLQITFSGQFASAASPGANWVAVAAASSASGYQLYWKNSVSLQYSRWLLNASGALTTASILSPAALYAAESTLNYDLSNDGVIGLGYVAGAKTIGGLNLGTTALGYALQRGSDAPIPITFSGQNASASNPGANWVPVAAASSGSGYQVYWKNNVSQQYSRWLLDPSGALTTAAILSPAALYDAESSIQDDLNRDGITGLPFTPSATIGGLSLGTTPFGYALQSAGGAPIPITFSGGNASASNPGGNWTAIAAASTASGFDCYWRNTVTSQFSRWSLNPSGLLSSFSLLTPAQVITSETTIGFDLNGNGIIGAGIS